MRSVWSALELAGWFLALVLVGVLYVVFVDPGPEQEHRRRKMRADD